MSECLCCCREIPAGEICQECADELHLNPMSVHTCAWQDAIDPRWEWCPGCNQIRRKVMEVTA